MGGAAMVLGRLFHQEAEMSEPGRVCINRRWWERDVVEGVWISDGGLDSPDVDDWPAACRQIADLTRELEEARAENARMREDAARWPDTESLALQVLDEVEAAIAAGRAMGHGAYAIVHRLRRLLTPSRRADGGAGGA